MHPSTTGDSPTRLDKNSESQKLRRCTLSYVYSSRCRVISRVCKTYWTISAWAPIDSTYSQSSVRFKSNLQAITNVFGLCKISKIVIQRTRMRLDCVNNPRHRSDTAWLMAVARHLISAQCQNSRRKRNKSDRMAAVSLKLKWLNVD